MYVFLVEHAEHAAAAETEPNNPQNQSHRPVLLNIRLGVGVVGSRDAHSQHARGQLAQQQHQHDRVLTTDVEVDKDPVVQAALAPCAVCNSDTFQLSEMEGVTNRGSIAVLQNTIVESR